MEQYKERREIERIRKEMIFELTNESRKGEINVEKREWKGRGKGVRGKDKRGADERGKLLRGKVTKRYEGEIRDRPVPTVTRPLMPQ